MLSQDTSNHCSLNKHKFLSFLSDTAPPRNPFFQELPESLSTGMRPWLRFSSSIPSRKRSPHPSRPREAPELPPLFQPLLSFGDMISVARRSRVIAFSTGQGATSCASSGSPHPADRGGPHAHSQAWLSPQAPLGRAVRAPLGAWERAQGGWADTHIGAHD